MPFNIGDRVRIVAHECNNQRAGHNRNMADDVGLVSTITRVLESVPHSLTMGNRNPGYRLTDSQWTWDERQLVS